MKSLSGPEKQYSCRQVYEEGAALLEELEDGRLDARLLLEHFCGINTNRLLSDPESPVGEEKEGLFWRRQGAGRPESRWLTLSESSPLWDCPLWCLRMS